MIAIALLAGASIWVHTVAHGRIYSSINDVPNCKVALVLGSRIYSNGQLSGILQDRVRTAVKLYKIGKVKKLLMSGDNRFVHYNEPQRMHDYAVGLGVPDKDIVMDFAGRRTYDSIYRAKHIFGQNKLIVVSQGFHLNRAIFLSDRLGVKSYGVAGKWSGTVKNRIRELPACVAAVAEGWYQHPATIMGKKEKI
jgi:SanA protein